MSLPSPRATIRTIAARARLSTAGVSLALRNHPSIPPHTCARVQQIAERLGYRPDPELAKLMGHLRRSRAGGIRSTLALLTSYEERSPWRTKPFLRRTLDGAVSRAEQLGYRLEELWLSEPGMGRGRAERILRARGIQGVVVLGTPSWTERLDFDFREFACSSIGYSIRVPFHRASQHHFQEMMCVLRNLERLGYRRPGLALRHDTEERTLHAYTSALLWWQSRNPESQPLPILSETEISRAAFTSWFQRNRPDVVIAQSPPAPEYLAWLRQIGSPAPEKTGFVSLDVDVDLPFRCSGIRQEYERVASAAVDLVTAQLLQNEMGLADIPKVVLIEGQWVQGETVRV